MRPSSPGTGAHNRLCSAMYVDVSSPQVRSVKYYWEYHRPSSPSAPSWDARVRAAEGLYARMFTARAATSRTVIAESVDSAAINALAGRVSGIASVGLNAVAFVSDT